MKKKISEITVDFVELLRTRSWETFHGSRGYYAFRQVFLYGLIGGGCATLDFLLYIFFSRVFDWTPYILQLVDLFVGILPLEPKDVSILYTAHWNIYFPNFLSINAGILCSFLLNAYFNFKRSDKLHLRALKFFAIGYCGLILSMFILRFGAVLFSAPDWAVKIFSVFFVAALQFVLNKFITFDNSATAEEPSITNETNENSTIDKTTI